MLTRDHNGRFLPRNHNPATWSPQMTQVTNAMLLEVHISENTGRKTDKESAQEIARSHGATDRMFKATNELILREDMAEISALTSQFKAGYKKFGLTCRSN